VQKNLQQDETAALGFWAFFLMGILANLQKNGKIEACTFLDHAVVAIPKTSPAPHYGSTL